MILYYCKCRMTLILFAEQVSMKSNMALGYSLEDKTKVFQDQD